MVNYQAGLDATFGALADGTRRAILARLSESDSSISELARPFSMSLPAVLKHVEVLERAGLVDARKDGRVRRCRLEAAPLQQASDWIAHYRKFWQGRFQALERYLAETTKEESWPQPRSKRRRSSASRTGSPPPARGSTGRGRNRSS
jgi:DNA-binding transcriptional ArsR family regulator